MTDEWSFIVDLTACAQEFAYNIYQTVYNNPNIKIEEDCIDDFYLNTFIKILCNHLEKHGFKIISVNTEWDDYGNEYTIIELEKFRIEIRNTIMCGVREGFEFIVVPK